MGMKEGDKEEGNNEGRNGITKEVRDEGQTE